jgi:hypothetical protein
MQTLLALGMVEKRIKASYQSRAFFFLENGKWNVPALEVTDSGLQKQTVQMTVYHTHKSCNKTEYLIKLEKPNIYSPAFIEVIF